MNGKATPKHTHMPSLTNDILVAAIEGFESQKRRLDDQIAELRRMMSATPAQSTAAPPARKGARKLSADARARIGEAQRKRWAAQKAAEPATAATKAPASKRKRRLSAAGRKAIIEATKKRWAKVHAAKAAAGKAESKPRKKAAKRSPAPAAAE
jgi:hypothetical protein